MQSRRPTGHGRHAASGVHGHVDVVARQVELAEDDRVVELRRVDDGQAIGARGDVGRLPLSVLPRALNNDFFGLTTQRQARDDATGESPPVEWVEALFDLGQVRNPIRVRVVVAEAGSVYQLDNISKTISVGVPIGAINFAQGKAGKLVRRIRTPVRDDNAEGIGTRIIETHVDQGATVRHEKTVLAIGFGPAADHKGLAVGSTDLGNVHNGVRRCVAPVILEGLRVNLFGKGQIIDISGSIASCESIGLSSKGFDLIVDALGNWLSIDSVGIGKVDDLPPQVSDLVGDRVARERGRLCRERHRRGRVHSGCIGTRTRHTIRQSTASLYLIGIYSSTYCNTKRESQPRGGHCHHGEATEVVCARILEAINFCLVRNARRWGRGWGVAGPAGAGR